jgi:hypothetical protein
MVVTSHQSGVHVVAFPFALKGHMGPFMQFSKSLANYGIDVTFITTSPHLASTQNFFKAHHNVHIACFDMPTEHGEVTPDNFRIMAHHINNLRDAFFELMKALFAQDGTSITSLPSLSHFGPPLCIISDMFLSWTQDVADEFGIPRYCLCVASACYLSFLYNFPYFCAQGLIPGPSDGEPLIIPGFPPISPCDVPVPRGPHRTKAMEFLQYHGGHLQKTTRLLVNSTYELESGVIDSLQNILCNDFEGNQVPKILAIGPLLENFAQGKQHPKEMSQVEHQNHECLQWLGKQPISSVLYICFGTISMLSTQQMYELALGLEASGVRFLWVVRGAQVGPNGLSNDKSLGTFLPQGFLERTNGIGLMYSSQAPQLHCLAHPAIGGFMTQCGWNSAIESIAMGVPMITWPLEWAEQEMNAQFCVDVLDVAVPIHNKGIGSKKIVGKEEVERVIRLLMEDGQVQRSKVKELSKILGMACAPGGSSRKALNIFVEELHSMASIKFMDRASSPI